MVNHITGTWNLLFTSSKLKLKRKVSLERQPSVVELLLNFKYLLNLEVRPDTITYIPKSHSCKYVVFFQFENAHECKAQKDTKVDIWTNCMTINSMRTSIISILKKTLTNVDYVWVNCYVFCLWFLFIKGRQQIRNNTWSKLENTNICIPSSSSTLNFYWYSKFCIWIYNVWFFFKGTNINS